MHTNHRHARTAPRCLAQTRQKTPCQRPPSASKRRCRMHGGHLYGGPRGNQYAVKHGRFATRMIMLKRQARQEQHRVQGLALLAR